MSSDKFTFKQFEVWHNKCGMKVGTDGVLLGAWIDTRECRSMLDIGTGTGLIALIAAQRNPNLSVTAIDIMPDAVAQARENVIRSPFADRIEVLEGDFLDMESAVGQDGHPTPMTDSLIYIVEVLLIFKQIVLGTRLPNVNQMIWYLVAINHIVCQILSCSNVHAAIHLARISRDYLPANF